MIIVRKVLVFFELMFPFCSPLKRVLPLRR